MKQWLRTFPLLVLLICIVSPDVQAQDKVVQQRSAPAPENICIYHVDLDDAFVRRPAAQSLSSTKTAAVTITVNYLDDGTETWPSEAISAFDYAIGLWEQTITSGVEIEVNANWADLGGCSGSSFALGSAGPTQFWSGGAFPESDTFYPDALADALSGSDVNLAVNGTDNVEITSNFNRDCDDAGIDRWYFGTDANPASGQVDFVSVVLHEIGHGLGFTGAGEVTEGDAGTNDDDTGTVLLSGLPVIYDRFTEDGSSPPLSLLNNYTDGSNALAHALEGREGGVFFNGSGANAANGSTPPTLYAPDVWQSGSSYAHLDETTYNGTSNALMTPVLNTAEAQHQVGDITCGMFGDMGWSVDATDCSVVLPVELTAFDAVADGEAVTLRWETASETNNAGFEVQYLRLGEKGRAGEADRSSAPWQGLTFVEGHGTTAEPQAYRFVADDLAPGTHVFRLKQVDFDGTFEYSPEVEAGVEMSETYRLTNAYPNPFNPTTQFSVAVRRAQDVRVDVFDVTGRRVRTLFDGRMAAQHARTMTFDAQDLPSGLYVIRAVGEAFSGTEPVVLAQ